MTPTKILISASGTGGHLLPALHIMKALKKKGVEVCFVGSGRPLEEKIIGGAGFRCEVIPAGGLKNKGVLGALRFLTGIPKARAATKKLFADFQPDVVLGVGGYATFFPVAYARLKGIPAAIHESELRPGLANKVLSFLAQHITLAFAETRFAFVQAKAKYTGQPVREELLSIAGQSRRVDRPHKLLVLGGSQGANGIDQVMMKIAPFLKKNHIHVWHQCRESNRDDVEERYHELEIHHRVVPFIEDMPEAYSWCHIIISRAGAGAVMEIGLINRPAIFVPLQTAQGDHQRKNATTLAEQGKAYVVEEGEDFAEQLQHHLEKLLDQEHYNRIRLRAAHTRPTDAAEVIAADLLAFVPQLPELPQQ